tara:strand:+ start:43 stop:1275 length:1233 start_codon:yes stop_codon:yes gene_type:complete
MFKMGGPVKEGVMEGIKEPRQNFVVGGAALSGLGVGLRALASRLPAFLRPAGAGTRTVPKLGPPTAGTPGGTQFSKGFPGPRLPGTAGTGPGTAEVPLSALERFRTIPAVARDPLLLGLTGPAGTGIGGKILGGLKSTAKYSLTTPTGLIGTELIFSPVRKTVKALFGDDTEIEGDKKEKAKLPGQDPKGSVNVDSKVEVNEQGGSAPSNQFNDDGTKKDTSVQRLLKGIVKRARTDAAADTAIKFGQQLRTGEASIKDPSSVIDVASGEFDKVSDIQKKVDLALIENELKKQQIAAQATATTEKALEIERRKRSMITMGDLVRADKSGMGLTHSGTLGIAREFADLTNKKYRGSIGNDDLLAKFEKNDRFKTDELGVITEKLQGGDDGLYILGTRVYEKSGPIVKLIKT